MTAAGTLLVNHRLSTHNKRKSTLRHLLKRHRRQANQPPSRHSFSGSHLEKFTMSKALIQELDLKMQQVKEYGLIAHGYHNENVQYPVHVRRSHDGEKVPRSLPLFDRHHRTTRSTNPTILTSSSHENQTSATAKRKPSLKKQLLTHELQQRIFLAPPNKTIDDIDPSLDRDHSFTTGKPLTRLYYHRKSSSSSATSSPTLCSSRPHSIACLSTAETVMTSADSSDSTKTEEEEEETSNSLLQSSQSLSNPPTTTITTPTPRRTLTQRLFSKLFHNPSKS